MRKSTSLSDIFAEQELLERKRARAEMEAERLRYETDPEYRAEMDAKFLNAQDMFDIADDDDDDEDDDEEDDEEDQ